MSPGSPLSIHLIFAGNFCRRFLHARQFDVKKALDFFRVACQARKDSSFFDFYENVDVIEYEQTRKLVCSFHLPEWTSQSLTSPQCLAWTGRRDKRGLPICLFNMKYLTSNLGAYIKSCGPESAPRVTTTGLPSLMTLRSLGVFEGIVRFVLPLCSLIRKRPNPETPIFQATVIADISAVSLVQIWRIRSWLQFYSKILADSYPEILRRIIVSSVHAVPRSHICRTEHQYQKHLIDGG